MINPCRTQYVIELWLGIKLFSYNTIPVLYYYALILPLQLKTQCSQMTELEVGFNKPVILSADFAIPTTAAAIIPASVKREDVHAFFTQEEVEVEVEGEEE